MLLGLSHLHKRRKEGRTPALDMLIYIAAGAAPLALVPQVLQVYETHDVSSLSLPTWLVLGCINVLWVAYGHVHKERPVMLSNAAFMVLNFSVAVAILLYR